MRERAPKCAGIRGYVGVHLGVHFGKVGVHDSKRGYMQAPKNVQLVPGFGGGSSRHPPQAASDTPPSKTSAHKNLMERSVSGLCAPNFRSPPPPLARTDAHLRESIEGRVTTQINCFPSDIAFLSGNSGNSGNTA